MTRIEQEKKTVHKMIALYCHRYHDSSSGLCADCQHVEDYAFLRLDHCRYGADKPTCENCPIHCYKPEMRENIRTIMRYSGPLMLLYHPISAIRHLLR